MIIYKPTDRIEVKIGEVRLKISPLTALQKTNLMSITKMKGGEEVADLSQMALMTLKYSVKDISGVNATFADGSEFKLDYEEDGTLSEDGLTALMQVLDNGTLTNIAARLLGKGISGLNEVPGVEIGSTSSVDYKKKPAT